MLFYVILYLGRYIFAFLLSRIAKYEQILSFAGEELSDSLYCQLRTVDRYCQKRWYMLPMTYPIKKMNA